MLNSVRISKDFEHMKLEYNLKKNSDSCCFDILEETWADATKAGGSIENKRNFNLLICGPTDSPYENGLFEINIKLNDEYPLKAPNITFISEIYHPNIKNSSICLSTLKNGSWSPALMLYKVLMSIQALLADPNPDDPLDPVSAAEFKANKKKFLDNAIAATQRATDKINEKKKYIKEKKMCINSKSENL